MGSIVSGIGDALGFGGGGDDSSKAAIEASTITADAQREALAYLKEQDKLPTQFRDQALKYLAGSAGLPGGTGSQQTSIDAARQSPLYDAMMGTLGASEDAILRNQSMTGGLRSGNTQDALAKNAQQLEQNALLQSYTQQQNQLQGLAGLPSLAPQIASGISGIGATQGQGIVAAAQANQAGSQAGMSNMMGLGQLGLGAYEAFSDPRLKSNVKKIGEAMGLNIYSWDWNGLANKLGLVGKSTGPMADEVEALYPEAVTMRDGYKFVTLGDANV